VGTRMVFTLPLELRANWIFRVLPLPGLRGCLAAIRRSLYTLGVIPVWTVMAAVFFRLWPWRAAAEHMVMLAILGVLMAECTLIGFQKIPFTCSYLPGKSKFHMAGLAALGQMLLMSQGAEWERDSFDNPFLYAWIAGGLLAVTVLVWWYNSAHARSEDFVVQFEDVETPTIQGLGLYRDGSLPLEPERLPQ
jgi:hypothetical protein